MKDDEKDIAKIGLKDLIKVGLMAAIKTLDDDEIYSSLEDDGFSEEFIAGFQYAVELLCWMEEDIDNDFLVELEEGGD